MAVRTMVLVTGMAAVLAGCWGAGDRVEPGTARAPSSSGGTTMPAPGTSAATWSTPSLELGSQAARPGGYGTGTSGASAGLPAPAATTSGTPATAAGGPAPANPATALARTTAPVLDAPLPGPNPISPREGPTESAPGGAQGSGMAAAGTIGGSSSGGLGTLDVPAASVGPPAAPSAEPPGEAAPAAGAAPAAVVATSGNADGTAGAVQPRPTPSSLALPALHLGAFASVPAPRGRTGPTPPAAPQER